MMSPEAPRKPHPTILAGLGHEIEIGAVVILMEEGRHSAIAALGDMVGNPWCNNACNSRHALEDTNIFVSVKLSLLGIKYDVPGNRPEIQSGRR